MPEHSHHAHGHGHHHDRGWRAVLRYLRLAPKLWSSPMNRIVIDALQIQPGEHVIDIGAGMGAGTVLAARSGAQVTAVEPTRFLRGVLRMRRLGQRARARIAVVDGAAESLPVPDASVDVALAVNVMHHWTDVDRATGELGRALRAHGRVLLVDERFDDPNHPAHDQLGDRHRHRARHFDDVDPATIGTALERAGFVVQEAAPTTLDRLPAKVVRATRS